MTNYKAIRGHLRIVIVIMILQALCVIGMFFLNVESSARHSKNFDDRWLLWGIGEDGRVDQNTVEYSTNFYEMTSVISNISLDHEKICLERRSLMSDKLVTGSASNYDKILTSSLSVAPVDWITAILCAGSLILSVLMGIFFGCIWRKSREPQF